MQDWSSIHPYVTGVCEAGVGAASAHDLIDHNFLYSPECVRSASDQQWSIVLSNGIQMDSGGDHPL